MALNLYTRHTLKALPAEAHAGSPDARWCVGDAVPAGSLLGDRQIREWAQGHLAMPLQPSLR